MKTAGIYLAVAGALIIVIFILYEVIKAVASVPLVLKIGLTLLVVGGIVLIAGLIQERIGDSKKGTTREVKH